MVSCAVVEAASRIFWARAAALGFLSRFVEHTKLRSGLSWRQYRKRLGIANHVHYRYEDCSMPLHVFRKALKVAKVTHNEAKRYRYRLVKSPEETILKLYRSKATAEFVGICLGDGHLNPYYLAIFGDKSKDTAYLLRHVKPLTPQSSQTNAKIQNE